MNSPDEVADLLVQLLNAYQIKFRLIQTIEPQDLPDIALRLGIEKAFVYLLFGRLNLMVWCKPDSFKLSQPSHRWVADCTFPMGSAEGAALWLNELFFHIQENLTTEDLA